MQYASYRISQCKTAEDPTLAALEVTSDHIDLGMGLEMDLETSLDQWVLVDHRFNPTVIHKVNQPDQDHKDRMFIRVGMAAFPNNRNRKRRY